MLGNADQRQRFAEAFELATQGRFLPETRMTSRPLIRSIAFTFVSAVAVGHAQQQIGVPVPPLGAGPFVFDTAEQHKIRVSVVTRGLSHPWSLAFLPDGAMLIAERPGRLRIVRNGSARSDADRRRASREDRRQRWADGCRAPSAVRREPAGLPHLHQAGRERQRHAVAGARPARRQRAHRRPRSRWCPTPMKATAGLNGRVAFGRDGMVYFSTGGNIGKVAQDPASLRGKILRLRDDGSVPPDNPFVGRAGYRPEIYTLGHRNTLALIVHPETGVLWNNENGPNGGDEINIILPGRNYGWPLVSFGRDYPGPRISEHPTREGMESPLVAWLPQIAAAGMAIYTGDRFPAWKGNVFVGSMRTGGIAGTGHLRAHRVQRQDRGAAPRIDAERAAAAHPGSSSRSGWAAVSADRRRRRRAAADRASFVNRGLQTRLAALVATLLAIVTVRAGPAPRAGPRDHSAHRRPLSGPQRQLVHDLSRHARRHHPRRSDQPGVRRPG